MTKKLVAIILWAFAGLYLGSYAEFVTGASSLSVPIGTAFGLIAAVWQAGVPKPVSGRAREAWRTVLPGAR